MGYFANNYHHIKYPIAQGELPGLRNAQIGAIHSIASHFTISRKPAIVVMPTGTGKTAVLMMSPFVLKANRVLVITPSKLVRNQIAMGIKDLQPLRTLGVLSVSPNEIRVKELKNEIRTMNGWSELSNFHVIVSTPNCISPGIEAIQASNPDFFDLILIDEAHHSPANSWIDIVNHYTDAKKILFTATPFRRDKKEIPGKVIYNYPISQAYMDGVFGPTEFIAVEAEAGNDVAIAKKCEQVFRSEPAGTVHYVMVRTDSKKRASELFQIYHEHTSLRLNLIHSGLSAARVEQTLGMLRNGVINGIICVDMLGEGFDFPNLKIAAIHSPHKSLAATLQFIGRFTRTNANNITHAKFIAIPAEIEIEKHYLYKTNAIWRELIIEMSEGRIDQEISSRELIDGFQVNQEDTTEDFQELSLSSIEPFFHVKIYAINRGDYNCESHVDMDSFGLQIVHREENADQNLSVLILQYVKVPKWSKSNILHNTANHLVITYFDEASSLLIINSTIKKSVEFYEFILESYCTGGDGVLLSDRELNSVLANIDAAEFFNIGMRNRSHYGANVSYKTTTGPTAHLAIERRDANNFHRGHLMGKGIENGEKTTIGLSSSSKVWSQQNGNLNLYLAWARAIAQKINAGLDGRTNTPIDDLPTSVSLETLPEKDVVAVNWHESAYKEFVKVIFHSDANQVSIDLTDIQLKLNYHDSDHEHYKVRLICEHFDLPIFFSYNYDNYFNAEDEALAGRVTIFESAAEEGINIIEYLNHHPLIFYYMDFSMLYNSYHYLDAPANVELFLPELIDATYRWRDNHVDIENECSGPTSIHAYLKIKLAEQQLPFTYYDHGSGEIADFITCELESEEVLIRFYHCKGSGAPHPGNRVDDLYEVIGQCIKSLIYTNVTRLLKRLRQRQKGKVIEGPCSDSVEILETWLANYRSMKVAFQVVIVQPGITKAGIEDRISMLLSSTNSTIRNTNNCRDLYVIASES